MLNFVIRNVLTNHYIFRVYMDENLEVDNNDTHIRASPLELTVLDLRYHGATICSATDKNLSHVMLHKR